MNEDDAVIKTLRQRITLLNQQINNHEYERNRYQTAANVHANRMEEARVERDATIDLVASLLDHNTVIIDVPRRIVVDALNKEGGDNDQTT